MDWMIYGANGYTGALIAREAKLQGMSPVLAGRNAARITALSSELQLPSRVFALEAPPAIEEAVRGVRLVLNCAGPFSKTADPVIGACLAVKAHYLDITGELDVLEGVHRLDAAAKAAGIVLCPGVGFDVVPTDCIALMLKKAMPNATELALGFETAGRGISAGTAKSLVEGLGLGGKVRRAGELADCPFGSGLRHIDFGRGEKLAMPIRWGDVASAYYTTGIPNIAVYTPVSSLGAAFARLTRAFAFLLRRGWLQERLAKRIEEHVQGPDSAERAADQSWVWGEAKDPQGQCRVVRILAPNGYSLTIFSALAITRHVLTQDGPAGSWTPAALMGEDFILRLPGTAMLASRQQAA